MSEDQSAARVAAGGSLTLHAQVTACSSLEQLSQLVNHINYMRPSGKGRRQMLRDVKAKRQELKENPSVEVQEEPKP